MAFLLSTVFLVTIAAIVLLIFHPPSFDAFYPNISSASVTDRPLSRLFVIYIQSEDDAETHLALIESWISLFQQRKASPMDLPIRGILERKHGTISFPWLTRLLNSFQTSLLADVLPIGNNLASGPPLINDFLVISASSLDTFHSKHPACDVLGYAALEATEPSLEYMKSQGTLEKRTHEALLDLQSNMEKRNAAAAGATIDWNEVRHEARNAFSRCFFMKQFVPSIDSVVFKKESDIHRISALFVPNVAGWASQYSLVFSLNPSDSLLPHINDPRMIPWVKEDGDGGLAQKKQPLYVDTSDACTDWNEPIIAAYNKVLGVNDHQLRNAGNRVYGNPSDVYDFAKLTTLYSEYILKKDAIFSRDIKGEPLKWDRTHVSFYGATIAINEMVNKGMGNSYVHLLPTEIIGDADDIDTFVAPMIVVNTRVEDAIKDMMKIVSTANVEKFLEELAAASLQSTRWWTKMHSFAGLFVRKYLLGEDPWGEIVENKHNLNGCINSNIAEIAKLYVGCPLKYPFPYRNNSDCCMTNLDCRNKPLTATSQCCQNNKFSTCAGFCQEGAVPPPVEWNRIPVFEQELVESAVARPLKP